MARINSLIFVICIMNILYAFAQFNNTTPYPTSTDGTCGKDYNTTCGNFDCCSSKGYCGGVPTYCGDGCQKDFGFCGFIHDGMKIIETCKEKKTLALTFDDGPRPWSFHLLGELKRHNIKATFFVNGHNQQDFCIFDHAEILRAIFHEGHLLGAHTWSHDHMAQQTHDEVRYQIDRINAALKKILGVTPKFFRSPYGEGNNYKFMRKYLKHRGYKYIVGWDVDTNDWMGNLTYSKELFVNGTLDEKAHVVLMHDRMSSTTDELAPFVIEYAKELGYKFDTVAGCEGIHNPHDWYNHVGGREERDYNTWVCNPYDMHNFTDNIV